MCDTLAVIESITGLSEACAFSLFNTWEGLSTQLSLEIVGRTLLKAAEPKLFSVGSVL